MSAGVGTPTPSRALSSMLRRFSSAASLECSSRMAHRNRRHKLTFRCASAARNLREKADICPGEGVYAQRMHFIEQCRHGCSTAWLVWLQVSESDDPSQLGAGGHCRARSAPLPADDSPTSHSHADFFRSRSDVAVDPVVSLIEVDDLGSSAPIQYQPVHEPSSDAVHATPTTFEPSQPGIHQQRAGEHGHAWRQDHLGGSGAPPPPIKAESLSAILCAKPSPRHALTRITNRCSEPDIEPRVSAGAGAAFFFFLFSNISEHADRREGRVSPRTPFFFPTLRFDLAPRRSPSACAESVSKNRHWLRRGRSGPADRRSPGAGSVRSGQTLVIGWACSARVGHSAI